MLRFVTRVCRRWLTIATVVLFALALVAAACSDSSTTIVNPTTGVLIRAESLTTGRGCGSAATNVYKYAVVVFGYNGVDGGQGDRANYDFPLVGNIYDCFADGEFISLQTVNGSQTYRMEVYAYNRAAYEAAQGDILAAANDCSNPSACRNTRNDGGLFFTSPTWTTVCTATQLTEVETLAVCDPLAAGLSGLAGGTVGATSLTLDTSSFRLPDGRVGNCGPGVYDAGTTVDAGDAGDAAVADGGDAGDAGDGGDAGVATVPFATARIRYRLGAAVGPTVDLACPAQFTTIVASEAAVYAVDVGLVDSVGTIVGQTLCTGTAVPGQATAIVCP